MRRDVLAYDLPEELIAKRPPASRDGARLLVLDGELAHRAVVDLPDLIAPGSLLVVNDTRVIPARLFGHKRGSGGRVELLLVQNLGGDRWRAMGRASKPLRPGVELELGEHLSAQVEAKGGADGLVDVAFTANGRAVSEALESIGHVPLPPYVRRDDEPEDRERYQTVFARVPGAVAAPTAGLHLSRELLERLERRRIAIAHVTLHVGLGTFQPVTADDLDDHPMHEESFIVPPETAQAIADARDRDAEVVAVGTTVVRALESAADPERPGRARSMAGETRLLIQPGYGFRCVDRLLTNFHLPESTLLALVCAFGGTARVLAAYRAAIAEKYRFFSYGDAMLVTPPRGGP